MRAHPVTIVGVRAVTADLDQADRAATADPMADPDLARVRDQADRRT